MPCDIIFFIFLFLFLFSSPGQTVASAQLPSPAYRPTPDVSLDVAPNRGWMAKTSERPKREIAGINRASEPGKKETNQPRTIRASIPRTPSPENYAMMKESLL